MSEQSNKKSISEKLKNTKINRAGLIGAVLVLVLLAVIISVTVISNRAKKKEETPPPSDSVETVETKAPVETPAPTPQGPSEPTPTPPADNSSPVENQLPSFVLPVSGMLSQKHDPEHQVHSTTMNDYRVHVGVDIVTEEGAPVYAAADGTVSKIWKDPMMGYSMAVKHSGNCYTIYKNLSETLPSGIKEGTAVRSGQLIASVGESAMLEVAEEPHLHFEMTVADLAVDPLEYFSEKALESLSIDASYGE